MVWCSFDSNIHQCSTLSLVINNSLVIKFWVRYFQWWQQFIKGIEMFPKTMTLLANLLKIHFFEYCQTNISLTGSQFSQSQVCLLYTPYSSHPRISQSKFPVLSISPFPAESGQTSYRKVPCFTNKVLEWYKHVFQFSLILRIHLMTRSELQFS